MFYGFHCEMKVFPPMTEAHLENTDYTHDAYIHDITIGRLPIVSIHRLLLLEFIVSLYHDP